MRVDNAKDQKEIMTHPSRKPDDGLFALDPVTRNKQFKVVVVSTTFKDKINRIRFDSERHLTMTVG